MWDAVGGGEELTSREPVQAARPTQAASNMKAIRTYGLHDYTGKLVARNYLDDAQFHAEAGRLTINERCTRRNGAEDKLEIAEAMSEAGRGTKEVSRSLISRGCLRPRKTFA